MRNSFLLGGFLILIAIGVANSGLDMMDVGFGLMFLSLFFALSAIVTGLVFIGRAREFDRLVRDLKPLAHWTYQPDEWQRFLGEDHKEYLAVNKATLKLVLVTTAVVGVLLLLLIQDLIMLWIILGIMLLVTVAAYGAPALRRTMLRKGVAESYVGEHAAYVGGSFQTWNQLGARLIGVDIYTDAPIPVLHIIFEFPTLQYSQEEIVRIPVPEGRMEEAKRIVGVLRKQIRNDE